MNPQQIKPTPIIMIDEIKPTPIIMINAVPTPREIVLRFLQLPWHKREGVLKSLGVVVFHANETERYTRAFRILAPRFSELVREVERAERQ